MFGAKTNVVSVLALLSFFLQAAIRANAEDSCSQLKEECEFQVVEYMRELERERQTIKTLTRVICAQSEENRQLELENERLQLTKQKACPVGFEFAAGATGCYRPINELLDWNTANTRCQQLYKGAYSVIVNNAAEHSAISNYMNAKMSSTCHFNDAYAGGFHVWTAGQRQNSSYNSPFVWKPNAQTSLPITYYNWLSTEPSRVPNGNEFCLLLVGTGSYSWHDGSCGLMSCALCEYGPYLEEMHTQTEESMMDAFS